MRIIRLLSIIALVAVPLTAHAARKPPTPKASYEQAQTRERTLAHRGLDAAPVSQVRSLIAVYADVVRRFPRSGYADNALFDAARLSSALYARTRDAGDRDRAVQSLQILLRGYPQSSLIKDARAQLKQLESPRAATKTGPPKPLPAPAVKLATSPSPKPADVERARAPLESPAARATAAVAASPIEPTVLTDTVAPASREINATAKPGAAAPAAPKVRLVDIRRAVLPEVVRVTLELDGEVAYQSRRQNAPAELVFVLDRALPPDAIRNSVLQFDDDVVRRIGVTEAAWGATELRFDLDAVERYSVFTLYGPYRVVVDFERRDGARPALVPNNRSTTVASRTRTVASAGEAPASPVIPIPAPPAANATTASRAGASGVDTPVSAAKPSPEPVRATAMKNLPTRTVKPVAQNGVPAATLARVSLPPTPPVQPALAGGRTVGAVEMPPPQPPLPAKAAPALPAPSAPAANSTGNFSIARQLGLGVSRIVLDPGHGGHDPGALGKKLTESELVLDVALRLEKLLLKNAGFDVTLTRRTDDFVPLEERTAMANRDHADLFLSIHANASRNASANGIETYFLNFATNADAAAVAARENSASGQTMHNLPDIVRAIATNNKLDESRDLARMVQLSLVDRLKEQNEALKDLGVKQAPFVVLIGAQMPSVLAEISFVTHPQEGALLKTGGYRQKIAEALFDAVMTYQRSLKTQGTTASQNP